MLIEIAIGDAYGRPFEFEKQFHLMKNDLNGYKSRPLERKNPRGKYTDDTQMSLAVAEHMLHGYSNDQEEYAKYFIKAYKRDVRGGYSKRLIKSLEAGIDYGNADFLHEARTSSYATNGCVMRVVPLGLLANVDEIKDRVFVQTIATHASHDAYISALAVALTAHYYYHVYEIGCTLPELKTFLSTHMGRDNLNSVISAAVWKDMPCEARATAGTCILLSWRETSMKDVLKTSVDIRGDVDSIASISLGLASLKGTKNDLPRKLYTDLENGKYGKGYIEMLDKQILSRFPSKKILPPVTRNRTQILQH